MNHKLSHVKNRIAALSRICPVIIILILSLVEPPRTSLHYSELIYVLELLVFDLPPASYCSEPHHICNTGCCLKPSHKTFMLLQRMEEAVHYKV